MNILFVRHGETEDNLLKRIAGTTNSRLTKRGMLQATSLGEHLVDSDVHITHIFSSDLQRAVETARLIRDAQPEELRETVPIVQMKILRERDFGSDEGAPYGRRADQNTAKTNGTIIPQETEFAMNVRAAAFRDDTLMPLMATGASQGTVVLVSSGLILGKLWESIWEELEKGSILLSPELAQKYLAADITSLKTVKKWENTGCYQINVRKVSEENPWNYITTIQNVNCIAHLAQGAKSKTNLGKSCAREQERG